MRCKVEHFYGGEDIYVVAIILIMILFSGAAKIIGA